MALNSKKKVVLGVVGTIVLGAVGSGVWETLFSPMASWLGRAFLSLVTLGLESARDSIYESVAEGHHEVPSLFVYAFLAALMAVFPLGLTGPVLIRDRLRQNLKEKTADELAILSRRLRRWLAILTAISVLLGSAFLGRFVMHSYVNKAVTHFEQSMRIVAPHIDISEERLLRSEFASIKSKTDFTAVMEKVRTIAQNHKKPLPDFTAW